MRTVDEKRRKKKTKQIVDAAARCFARNGFHNSGMAEICTEAKLSPGAMYAYFPSKKDIILAVTRDYLSDVEIFAETLRKSRNPVSLLVAAAREELKGINYPLEAEIYAEAVRNPAVMEILGETDKLIRSTLSGVFLARGFNKRDAVANADYIYVTFDGLRMYSILNSNSRNKKKLLKLFESTLRSLFENEGNCS